MRLKDLSPGEMSDDQKGIYAESVAGKRGTVVPPLRAWIHAPEMARHASRLGAFLRYDTTLGPRLSELAILVTARHWSAQFEWYAHKKMALDGGLDPKIIDAIRDRRTPSISDAKQQVIYDVARLLHEARGLPKPLYDAAMQTIGERGLAEVIGLCGYYTMVSMTLNTYEFPLPDGEKPELT